VFGRLRTGSSRSECTGIELYLFGLSYYLKSNNYITSEFQLTDFFVASIGT